MTTGIDDPLKQSRVPEISFRCGPTPFPHASATLVRETKRE
jgi:hypothetical protein